MSLKTRKVVSSTPKAHSDFVKTLLVLPTLNLLVSGGSDKIVRLWYARRILIMSFCQLSLIHRDLSSAATAEPLQNAGSVSSHTRPIECLAGYATSESSAILYTADTMGVLKIWSLEKEPGVTPARWRFKPKGQMDHHRTRINDMALGQNLIWTGKFAIMHQLKGSRPTTRPI